ncbi:YfaZ family outer membrane protein [Marinomonas transparens]|uniref:YfaZ n=1 Tax=Marinomonas transparens TaxID=2795388 RepID=A0A934JPG0_9GAMM|nr:YfaZ family outer membrane protein [Marinomonas transparens]MBJ7538228.1 hypothetical protein [Marinomonas transparens]
MTQTKQALLIAAGILSSSWVLASSADLNLTNDKANAAVTLNIDKAAVSVGGMYDEGDNTSYVFMGLGVEDAEANGPLAVGIGLRGYAIDTDRDSGRDTSAAVGVGGWYRYTFPQANRLSLYASGYYSPQILTISNADHVYNYEARLEYMTMRNARAYIRYSKMVVVFDDANESRKELDHGFSIGASVDF